MMGLEFCVQLLSDLKAIVGLPLYKAMVGLPLFLTIALECIAS